MRDEGGRGGQKLFKITWRLIWTTPYADTNSRVSLIQKLIIKGKLPHPVYAYILRIVVYFGRTYIGWQNQDKHFDNETKAELRHVLSFVVR